MLTRQYTRPKTRIVSLCAVRSRVGADKRMILRGVCYTIVSTDVLQRVCVCVHMHKM